jgi:hypothetical protein
MLERGAIEAISDLEEWRVAPVVAGMERNQPIPSAGRFNPCKPFIAQPPDFRCRSAARTSHRHLQR